MSRSCFAFALANLLADRSKMLLLGYLELVFISEMQVEGVDGQRAVQALHEKLFIKLAESERQLSA